MARGRAKKLFEAICPACGSTIIFRKRPNRGQIITCLECKSLLEILRLSPLELEWAFEDPLEASDWHQPDDDGYEGEWDYDDAFDGDDYSGDHMPARSDWSFFEKRDGRF